MYKLEKIESSLIDTQSIYKEIIEDPGKVFDLIRFDIRSMAERVLGELLKEEITHWLGRKRYQRSNEEDPNYRNGTKKLDSTMISIGTNFCEGQPLFFGGLPVKDWSS